MCCCLKNPGEHTHILEFGQNETVKSACQVHETAHRWADLLYQPQYYQSKAAQFTSELQVLTDWTLARLA